MQTLTEEIKRELAQPHEEFKNLSEEPPRLTNAAGRARVQDLPLHGRGERGEAAEKGKAHLKDRMEEIAREHRARVSAH